MAVAAAPAQGAFELKFGQVGVANLALRSDDPALIRDELLQKIAAAPALFTGAPVVIDLSRLPELPPVDRARNLIETVWRAGMMPVGLAYGTTDNAQLAQMLNLPLFAKFRTAAAGSQAALAAPAPAAASSAMHHDKAVRSGQQVYSRGRDLVLVAAVGSGAEVIADGSIHIYGRLGGRALAGAQGDTSARIYCQDFQAELVSIAGHYRVLDEVPEELRGKSVQARLDGERLVLEQL
jgi:septum site-determining protein MinC